MILTRNSSRELGNEPHADRAKIDEDEAKGKEFLQGLDVISAEQGVYIYKVTGHIPP